MRCPKISNSQEFVDVEFIDKGVRTVLSIDGTQYDAFVSCLEIAHSNKTYTRYYAVCDVNLPEIRIQRDKLFFQQHDLELIGDLDYLPFGEISKDGVLKSSGLISSCK